MSAHNIPTNYKATSHAPTLNYADTAAPSESRFDTAYLTSIRAILKYACLLLCFTSLICVVTTPHCSGEYVFLAVVAALVMIFQAAFIVIFGCQLREKFLGVDFELLDFFATASDSFYLLVASAVLINYCRVTGQMAGGAMGVLASFFLIADAVIIFLAQRKETETSSSGGR